jgi:hypothetical protein
MLWQGTQDISHGCQPICASHAGASSEKPRLVVQKLWMATIPCGKRWKNGQKFSATLLLAACSHPNRYSDGI